MSATTTLSPRMKAPSPRPPGRSLLGDVPATTWDESNLIITPAYPADLHTLTALFDRSSAESRRDRFHATLWRIPSRYLHDVAGGAPGVVARVVRDLGRDRSGDCVIALATAVPDGPDRAELAVWVDDDWHGRGVGMRAIRAVINQLVTDGVGHAVAYLAPTNAAANALARSLARAFDAPAPSGSVVTFDPTKLRIALTA